MLLRIASRAPRLLQAGAAAAMLLFITRPARAQWNGHGGDQQHTAISAVQSQSLQMIRWQTPVDLTNPAAPIHIHYGTPLITQTNTVIVPVRTSTSNTFSLQAIRASDGVEVWNRTTNFQTVPAVYTGGWVPSFSPTLTPGGQLYYQGSGGTVYRIDNPNSASSVPVQLSIFGDYAANQSEYNSRVFINTPLTTDTAGNIYFGYQALASSSPGALPLKSGIARIAPDGTTSTVSADSVSGVSNATGYRLATNSAPALNKEGTILYAALNGSTDRLVALNASNLTPRSSTVLRGTLTDESSASPTVGPDGDVYMGTLHGYHERGYLEHYSADLATSHAPGTFGWDITASIVPRAMVPTYTGTSSYLLMTKYNDYYETGGTGDNRLAILDPNATRQESQLGNIDVMKEVLTISGVTPEENHPGVKEWCINTAAVDPFTNSILVNSEDGTLYRWDLATNTFTESIELQAQGVLEAYTPTAIGPDGTVYAINKATLFAIVPEPGSTALLVAGALMLATRRSRQRRGTQASSLCRQQTSCLLFRSLSGH